MLACWMVIYSEEVPHPVFAKIEAKFLQVDSTGKPITLKSIIVLWGILFEEDSLPSFAASSTY